MGAGMMGEGEVVEVGAGRRIGRTHGIAEAD